MITGINKQQQQWVLGSRPLSLNKTTFSAVTEASKVRVTRKSLTPIYMNERRVKCLFYFYDEPYSPELQMHVSEITNEDEQLEEMGSVIEVTEATEPQIFLNALIGIASFWTMRITSYYPKRPLHILVHSGNTQFLGYARCQYGGQINEMDHSNAVAVDGSKLKISSMVKGFTWTIQLYY